MTRRAGLGLGRRWWALIILAVLGGYWLLPITGDVVITTGNAAQGSLWPQMRLDTRPGTGGTQTMIVEVTDVVPWAHVLLTVNGQPASLEEMGSGIGGTWTWKWSLSAKDALAIGEGSPSVVSFYRDCDIGCVEQGRLTIGEGEPSPRADKSSPMVSTMRQPTKLGVVFANPQPDWHGRAGWDVELTYARPTAGSYWGIDELAGRVHQAADKGLRVLVRVDFDQGQSLPPTDDHLALSEYLRYVQRLARDERLRSVYGYVIGSGFNALDSNSANPQRPVTPAWYARIFNGFGESASRTDNVVQTVRMWNSQVRVLVGPVRPWSADQNGGGRYETNAPWLDYMHALVAALDAGTRAKSAAGIPMVGPDGFALQVPGRPAQAVRDGRPAADEPLLDLRNPNWGAAQAGFRIYRDWLDIVNFYPSTRGLPAYITSSNTFAPDEGAPPAQNYPRGWLTNALKVIDEEPQVSALCWFLDGPLGDDQWDWFSLSRRLGRIIDADEELEALLRNE